MTTNSESSPRPEQPGPDDWPVAGGEMGQMIRFLEQQIKERTAALTQTTRDLQIEIGKRQEAETALYQSERQFHLLFDTMLHGSVYQDSGGQIISMNPAAERILGQTKAEILGLTSEDLEHGTLREDGSPFPGTEHPAMVALRTGQKVQGIVMGVFNPREQAYRWINISAVPLFNEDTQQPYQVYTLFEDITERKQAEKHFALAFQASPSAMSISRVDDGLIIEVNKKWVELFGYSRAEAVGQSTFELNLLVDPSERSRLAALVREQRTVPDFEMEVRRKSGEVRQVSMAVEMIELNHEPCLLFIVSDITERKQKEEALRASQEQLRSLVENAPISIAMFDGDMRYIVISGRWLVEYGRGYHDLIGRSHYEVHPDVPEQWKEVHQKGLAGQILKNEEDLWIQADGTKHWLRWAVVPWRNDQGKIGGILISTEDITERMQAEARVRVNAARLQVLADASRAFAEVGMAYQALLDQVARTTAKVLGEGCSIRLLSEDGVWLDLVALYDVDPEALELLHLILGEAPLQVDEPSLTTRIFHSRQPHLIPVINSDQVRAATKPEYGSLVDRLGIHSMIIVPMRVQGRVIGVLILYRHRREQPSFDEDDLSLAQDLADRAALAISNVRLLEQVQQDLAERKQAEESLRQSQDNFARAFNSSPAALAITRLADGKFLSLNEAYSGMMGYQPVEILGRTAADMNIYANPAERDHLIQQLREQGAVRNYELLVRNKSGEVRNLLVSMEPTLYNNEKAIISTFLDMTERKRVEEELRRSNAELEQFAYIASHDLQEPLRAITSMLQLLQHRYGSQLDARADEFIRHAVEGASRMQTLIADLLAFSRVATRGQPFRPTNCTEILSDVLANLAVAIRESGAMITHDALPTVMADRTQLSQLFQNLVGNAIKFRGEATPTIHISVGPKEGMCLFSVRDNGIGLESQYFERIFVIFQRLHTRGEYAGTGIGLAVCKKIVERHGGRIWVESVSGQGATFYFTLPHQDHPKPDDRD